MKKLLALFLVSLMLSVSFSGGAEIVEEEEYDEQDTGASISVNVRSYEPTILTSNLIQENTVPVYAYLSGLTVGSVLGIETNTEPLYGNIEIEKMLVKAIDIETNEYLEGDPKWSKPNKQDLDTLGYLTIHLKQFHPDNFEICSTDSDCDSGFTCETGACYPNEINLSLSAEIWFKNAERLYSLSKSALILPVDSDEDVWTEKLSSYGSMYGFYGGRGLIRVRDISSNTVDLTVYSNKDLYWPYTGAPRALADLSLQEGQTSDYVDLGYTDEQVLGSAKFRVTVNDIRDPAQERAVVSVLVGGAQSQVMVTEGSALYPGSSWTVQTISYGQGRSGYEYSVKVKSAKGNVETITATQGDVDSGDSAFLNRKFYSKGSKDKLDEDEDEVFFYDTGTKSILSQSFSSLKTSFIKGYQIDVDISEVEGDSVKTNALTLEEKYPLKEVLNSLLPSGYYYEVVDPDKNQIKILHYSSKDPCANAEVYEDAGVAELDFNDVDVQKSNDIKRGVFCGAVREFQAVIDEFDDEVLPDGSSVVDESYFMLGQSYDALSDISGMSEEEQRGADEKALSAYKYLVDKESKIAKAGEATERATTLQNQIQSGSSSVGISLDDNGQFVYAELISVVQLAREDGSSAVMSKDGVSETYYVGDAITSTSSEGKDSYAWYVTKISEDSLLVTRKYSTSSKTKSETISSTSSEVIEGSTFKLKSVALKKEAYLTITPGTGGSLRSKNNFSIHIPIEYRGLDLNPDQLDDRIEKAKKLKETLDEIYTSLEEIVRTWNYVCYTVWAALTVKNSFLDGTDASVRHDVIHGVDDQSGWYAYCQEHSGYKLDYDTYDECMLANTQDIEAGITAAEQAQAYVEDLDASAYDSELQDLIKGYEGSYEECDTYVGDEAFLDEKSKQDLLYNIQLQENLQGSVSQEDPFAKSVNDQVQDYGGYAESADLKAKQEACKEAVSAVKNTDLSKYKNDEKKLDAEQKKIASSVFAGTYTGELRRLKENGEEVSTPVGDPPKPAGFLALDEGHLGSGVILPAGYIYGGSGKTNEVKTIYTEDGASEVIPFTYADYETLLEDKRNSLAKSDGTVADQENHLIFEHIKQDLERLAGDEFKGKEAKAKQMSGTNGQQFYYPKSSSKKIEHIYYGEDAYVSGELNKEYASDAKIEIYSSGEFKGMPYCLPYKEGNFIKFISYTSANEIKVIEYWNVGPDGQLCTTDDILVQHESQLHYQTASPSYNSLVSYSNSFVKNTYIEGQQIPIKGISTPSSFKVSYGKSRTVQEGATASCYDVMDPGDCRLLFNTCDPVMCPPSRFNWGGRWQVDDVIQSGIIGSVILPQGSGDAVPVCLTGVLASLSFAKSLLDGYVECLEAAKYEGETVGICDKLYSVYWCELVVREGAAVLDNNKDGVLDFLSNKLYGREDSGGGEFLQGLEAGIENSANSFSYFTTEYAQSGLASFKGRSLEEVGTTICKQAIYSETPFFEDFMAQITTPEDPNQFYATLTIKPYAPSQGTAAYQTYYHIYAGNNPNIENVVYQVYLKNSLTGEPFYTTAKCEGVSETLELGGTADETIDCLAPEGFDTVCVVMNGETNCGFGSVSTSFGMNYLKDSIVADEVMRDIQSEKECYPSVSTSSPTAGSLALPYSYGELSTGIQRVCALQDPGLGEGGSGDWVAVGTCGEDSEGRSLGSCWLDTESFSLKDAEHSETANAYLEQINWEQRRLAYGLDEVDLKTEEQSMELYQKYLAEMEKAAGENACDTYKVKIQEYRTLYEQTLSYDYAAAAVYQIGRIYYALAVAEEDLKKCGLVGTEGIEYSATVDGKDIGTVERLSPDTGDTLEVTLSGLEAEDVVNIEMYPDLNDKEKCDKISNGGTTCYATIEYTADDDTTITIAVTAKGADEARFSKRFTFSAEAPESQESFAIELCGRCGNDESTALKSFLSYFDKCEKDECHDLDDGCYFVDGTVFNDCLACSDKMSCSDLNDDEEQCENSGCFKECEWDGDSCEEDTSGGGSSSGSGRAGSSVDCVATGGETDYENALLDMVAAWESAGSYYRYYTGTSAKKYFSDCEKGHPKEQGNYDDIAKPYAAGRYQFIYSTYKDLRDNQGQFTNDNFCESAQDKAALDLISDKRGVSLEEIKEGYDDGATSDKWILVIDQLAPEWDAFPYSNNGERTSYYNHATQGTVKDLYEIFDGCYKERAEATSYVGEINSVLAIGTSTTAASYAYTDYLNDKLDGSVTFDKRGYVGCSSEIVYEKLVSGLESGYCSGRGIVDAFDLRNYQALIVLAGLNDGLCSGDSQTTIDNLQAMYDSAFNEGLKVIAVTLTPSKKWFSPGGGYPCGSSSEIEQTVQYIVDVNAWILAKPDHVNYVVDVYSLLEDPTNPGYLNPEYNSGDRGDGLHPDKDGQKVIGKAIYDEVFQ